MKENSSNSSENKSNSSEKNFTKNSNNLSIRISIIGESKSGKTSLINCYLKKSFFTKNEDTILNIHSKKILINNKKINLIISEISSNQTDFSLLKQIESHIIFLTFNLEEKLNILNDLFSKIDFLNKNLPIFIVGCKLDLIKEDFIEKIKIYDDYDELSFFGENVKEFIKNKRKNFNIEGFYITSAMLNINIDKLFNDAIKTVCFPFVLEFYDRKNNNENNENDDEILDKILNVNENGCKIF